MSKKIKKRRKVAVFDIDGTIFRSSLLIELAEMLIAQKVFPASARRVYASAYRRWLDRKGDYEKYILAVIRAFEKNLKGVREKDFVRVARRVVAFHENRVYRYTRDLIKDLRKRGYYILAITHSPKYVAGDFGRRVGIHKVYGRLLELDKNGRFTGRTMHEDLIWEKSKILLRAAEKENLTLRGSVGVGDTESDASFLRLVEKPICFNPNMSLYKIARRRGWKVVVERKDVIYEIV
jgi:HAD superfamily hydrolase (TIGR01490 family)